MIHRLNALACGFFTESKDQGIQTGFVDDVSVWITTGITRRNLNHLFFVRIEITKGIIRSCNAEDLTHLTGHPRACIKEQRASKTEVFCAQLFTWIEHGEVIDRNYTTIATLCLASRCFFALPRPARSILCRIVDVYARPPGCCVRLLFGSI